MYSTNVFSNFQHHFANNFPPFLFTMVKSPCFSNSTRWNPKSGIDRATEKHDINKLIIGHLHNGFRKHRALVLVAAYQCIAHYVGSESSIFLPPHSEIENSYHIHIHVACAVLVENEGISPKDKIQPICTTTFHPFIL